MQNYTLIEQAFNSRRKNAEFKPFARWARIYKDGDAYNIVSPCFEWKCDEKTKKYYKHFTGETRPLARFTPDGVMTLTAAEHEMRFMSTRAMLQKISGFAIYSDTTNHRNKESKIRVWGKYYGPQGWTLHDWCKNNQSIPYKQGLQFKKQAGGRVDLLNPPQDVKVLVNQQAKQQAKADTAVLRKLVHAMARISWEEPIMERAGSRWANIAKYPHIASKIRLEDVNCKEPTGDDANAVLSAGWGIANNPDNHRYVDGQGWTEIPIEERAAVLRARIIDNGMKALRKVIYERTNGYERVVVS